MVFLISEPRPYSILRLVKQGREIKKEIIRLSETVPFETTNVEEKTKLGNPWMTLLFNDEIHSFDEVILQIQKATGYSLERAVELIFQVHQRGKAVIYIGVKEKCENVADILGQIRLITQVEES